MDRRPSVGKPGVDSFEQEFLEELVVIHDFEALEEDEVFISKGERVKVFNAEDPFWLWVETTPGVQGFVPRSCCSLGNHPCKLLSICTYCMVTGCKDCNGTLNWVIELTAFDHYDLKLTTVIVHVVWLQPWGLLVFK